MYIPLASVVCSPHLLTLCAVSYIHMYLACILYKQTVPVASCSLFLDIQLLTLLLGECTLFACPKFYYPTTMFIFFTNMCNILVCIYTHTIGCKRSLILIQNVGDMQWITLTNRTCNNKWQSTITLKHWTVGVQVANTLLIL